MARASSAAPLVSVVVPCFNHGRFLREALASVGTPDVTTEIVVIDDGSTDETPQVIGSFRTPNLFYPVRQPNAGLAAARNRGLKESRGLYLIFLDADDRLAAGAVDLAGRMLEDHADCALVYGRCQMMDQDGTPLPTPRQPRIARDHYRELLRRNHIWMPAMGEVRSKASAGSTEASMRQPTTRRTCASPANIRSTITGSSWRTTGSTQRT